MENGKENEGGLYREKLKLNTKQRYTEKPVAAHRL